MFMQRLIVKMERYVWLVEVPQEVQFRYARVVFGAMYVTIFGMLMMQVLSVGNLGYHQRVSIFKIKQVL